jgi:hypothetical protein
MMSLKLSSNGMLIGMIFCLSEADIPISQGVFVNFQAS